MKNFRAEMQQLSPALAKKWFEQGTQQYNSGNFEDALTSYDKALKIQPENFGILDARGATLFRLNRYEEGIACLNKVLSVKPDDDYAWNLRGAMLSHLNHYEEAIISFNNALAVNPNNHYAWGNRGIDLCDNLARYEEAITSCDKALKINPNFYEAWYNRGVALSHLSRHEEAIASYGKALEIKPNFHNAWNKRGTDVLLSPVHNPFPALVVGETLSQSNPQLNQRGYYGQVITLETGLTQVAPHSEGWGDLQCALGKAHFIQSKLVQLLGKNPSLFWKKARHCFELSLSVLSIETWPQLRLRTLENIIRVLLAQGENAIAQDHRKAGVKLLQTLLNQAPTAFQKQQIEAKFSGFSQIEVDVWLQVSERITALETAERFKNRSLNWILEEWKEEVVFPKHDMMQSLCTPGTAIVYWHLSPDSLATFILSDGSNTPEVLPSDRTAQAQQLTLWMKVWNNDYCDYASKKLTQTESENHPWRQNLQGRLIRLKEILKIETICQTLPDTTQNLILIPHRDLHLLPLHTFFPDHLSCTYLPSIQIGLTLQKQPSQFQTYTPLLSIEDPKTEQDPMPFAQLESAIVRHLVKPSTSISGEQATTATVLHNLQQPFSTLHFTGHSTYNARTPKASALGLADGLLTAETIAQQDLSSYHLVILSACETALTGNDGIRTEYVGLASAFLKAGATNVLSTLWPVDEISSTWLIIQFYQFLLAGDPPRIALMRAQQWLKSETWEGLANWIYNLSKLPDLKEGADLLIARAENTRKEGTIMGLNQPTKYSHPYHWAAFTLTGRG